MDELTPTQNDPIIDKVGEIMRKLHENQKLQQLAAANGLDVKNTINFTEDAVNNIAVSVAALMLAKQQGDTDYAALVRAGMGHRKIRTDLINKYKDQANQIITAYKMRLTQDSNMQ